MKNPSPSQIASFLRNMADKIDHAKAPSTAKVAADLRCVLAALDGNEEAVARVAAMTAPAAPAVGQSAPEAKPFRISFNGKFDPDVVRRAAEHVVAKRPVIAGQVSRITIQIDPA